MSAFFVTATGTDIGKTFMTAGLIRHLRAQDKAVFALKPVASGFDEAKLAESDAGVLLEALGRPMDMEQVAKISPFRFAAPLSPDQAAAREGKHIDVNAVIRFCREEMIASRGALFIEGIGGVMVPLDAKHTTLDLMMAQNLPIILVAGTYLGTLSHTLTALDVLVSRKLKVALVVINESEGGVSLNETITSVGRYAGEIPVAGVKRSGAKKDFSRLWNLIA